MAKALNHSPFLTGNQERREGGWCVLWVREWAKENNHSEVGVWRDHEYLILKNLEEKSFIRLLSTKNYGCICNRTEMALG